MQEGAGEEEEEEEERREQSRKEYSINMNVVNKNASLHAVKGQTRRGRRAEEGAEETAEMYSIVNMAMPVCMLSCVPDLQPSAPAIRNRQVLK